MKEKVLSILEEVCEDDIIRKEGDLNLFEEGLLDSLSLVQLLVMLEDEAGIVIPPSELNREDIATPDKLIAYVEERC